MEQSSSAQDVYEFITTELDPTEPEALSGLADIYDESKADRSLVDVLARLVEVTYEDDDRVTHLFRMGQVYEDRLEELETAAECYQTLLDLDPAHGQSLSRLANIYEGSAQWDALYDVHQRQFENASTDEERAELSAAMARLAEAHLERLDDAIDHWTLFLELSGEDAHGLRALERLYEGQESWREYARRLRPTIGPT